MGGKPRVRIPFGDLAARYMLNGMGYFNPHQSENYIMSAVSYLRFFFRYMLRTQPLADLDLVLGRLRHSVDLAPNPLAATDEGSLVGGR